MNRTILAALSGMVLIAAPASAQVPQASAAALGFGFNMTASSYGFAAVANNPAGLGHPNSPGMSLAIPAIIAEAGVGPVTLADLVSYEGAVVPDNVKSEWLQRVTASGGQAGALTAGITPFALSVGPVAFQLSAAAGGRASLNPDAVELLMYGNAGQSGTASDFDLEGSSIDGYVLTTGAVSMGFQTSPGLYLGATAKYTVGNGLAVGRDGGSSLTASPLAVQLDFPMIVNDSSGTFNNGSGVGLDIGAIWVAEGMTIGAKIENIVNTFEWSLAALRYVPGQAVFDASESTSDFDEQPASAAPTEFQQIVSDLTLKPAFSVGAEFNPNEMLQLRADIRKRSAGGMELGPEFHMGIGAELRALSILPIRAHVAKVTGGSQIGGGASLVLGPVHLSGGIALRTAAAENSTLGMFTLSFGAH